MPHGRGRRMIKWPLMQAKFQTNAQHYFRACRRIHSQDLGALKCRPLPVFHMRDDGLLWVDQPKIRAHSVGSDDLVPLQSSKPFNAGVIEDSFLIDIIVH